MARFEQAFLLYLQILLACWQIVRLTPIALLLKAMFLRFKTVCAAAVRVQLHTGYCLPGFSYTGPFLETTHDAKEYYKKPFMAILRDDGVTDLRVDAVYAAESTVRSFEWHNYTCTFQLEEKEIPGESNTTMLFLHAKINKRAIKYYITSRDYWTRVISLFKEPMLVVVKNKKRFLGSALMGEIMSPEEILDTLLLLNSVPCSDRGWLLPVVSPEEESKLLTSLNLLGVYGQLKKWNHIVISVLTLVVILLQFSNNLRHWLYNNLNHAVVFVLQHLVDKLSLKQRRLWYSLGSYLDKLEPCNNCEARVVKGEVMEFYSVSNVKCDDLTWKQVTVSDLSDDVVCLSNDFISGEARMDQDDITCYIQWGLLSNRSLFWDSKPACAMVKAMVEHKSGAVFSKEGKHVKVWGLVDTFTRMQNDYTAKVVLWEGKNVVVK